MERKWNESLRAAMKQHMEMKEMARKEKDYAKLAAQTTPNEVVAACFDLQKILIIPHSLSSQLYYRRKLATFDFTIYDMGK